MGIFGVQLFRERTVSGDVVGVVMGQCQGYCNAYIVLLLIDVTFQSMKNHERQNHCSNIIVLLL